ncbi:hypothetical protein VTL71DRAFT_944 [Oculimacula yallundae]|uniref:Uncharacterized protein n=1 Tax=Oculimacula yallundae TaxID=86028 RepID=A0ABR4D1F7_9HELO
MDSKKFSPRSQVNMGRSISSLQTPSRQPHSRKKQEKETARQLREAQQKSLSFHSERLCHHSDWEYIRSHDHSFPVQREAEPAKENILALKNNQSYSQSGIIQTYGKLNSGNDICGCCAKVFAAGRTRTWKGCVSFPVRLDYPDRKYGSVPFLGQCANCHWGSQGYKCSLRVGGVKVPPRRVRADLFQSSAFAHTHLGSKHDLNTVDGCANARQELQGVMNQLNRRSKKLQHRRQVDRVQQEKIRHNAADDDEGSDFGATNIQLNSQSTSQPMPQPTFTSRRRQVQKPSTPSPTPSLLEAAVNSDHDDDGDDDICNGPTGTPSIVRAAPNPRTRYIARSKPSVAAATSRSQKAVLRFDDDEDDEDFVLGPTSTDMITQTASTVRTRQFAKSKPCTPASTSRTAVVEFDDDSDDFVYFYSNPAKTKSISKSQPLYLNRQTTKSRPSNPASTLRNAGSKFDQNNLENDDDENAASAKTKSISRLLSSFRTRQKPEPSTHPKSRRSDAKLDDDEDDDDEYIGTANTQSRAQATPTRQTRRSSGNVPTTPATRIEVVVPSSQPSRRGLDRRSVSFHTQDGWY